MKEFILAHKTLVAIIACIAVVGGVATGVVVYNHMHQGPHHNLPDGTNPVETTAPVETTVPVTTVPETTTPETTAPVTTAPTVTEPDETTAPVETTVPETTVPETTVHEHDYKAKKVEPTCTKKGYTAYACACGESYRDDYVDAKGHQYKETKVEPTETTDGYTHHECQVCGDAYNDNFVDALGGNQPAETKPAETKPAETTPPATEPAETKPSGSAAIGNTTPATLTKGQWDSWDKETQKEFTSMYDPMKVKGETAYHYHQILWYGGYECPGPCRCTDANYHEWYSNDPCLYCGQTNCAAKLSIDHNGYSEYDRTKCPAYNIKNDPSKYCQTCGWPNNVSSEPDPNKRCHTVVNFDMECPHCGKMIYVGKCHHCLEAE